MSEMQKPQLAMKTKTTRRLISLRPALAVAEVALAELILETRSAVVDVGQKLTSTLLTLVNYSIDFLSRPRHHLQDLK